MEEAPFPIFRLQIVVDFPFLAVNMQDALHGTGAVMSAFIHLLPPEERPRGRYALAAPPISQAQQPFTLSVSVWRCYF